MLIIGFDPYIIIIKTTTTMTMIITILGSRMVSGFNFMLNILKPYKPLLLVKRRARSKYKNGRIVTGLRRD